MKPPGFVSRAMSLREAAAVIFVLVALLPLLLFVSVISVSGLISRMEAQFAAFMAVVIACLGFVVFRRLVDRSSASPCPGSGRPQRATPMLAPPIGPPPCPPPAPLPD